MILGEVEDDTVVIRQRAYFKSVTILVPQSWNLPDTEPSVGETWDAAEFRVAPGNPVYGNNPYTVQVGGGVGVKCSLAP